VRATIWGCRGSLAAPGPGTVRYGGNTSCVEVETPTGGLIVLDAGTGIRSLGVDLAGRAPETIHLLLTHLHLDHVEGLGFFAPLFRQQTTVHVWGPPSSVHSLEERVASYLSPPLFPLHLTDFPAALRFHDVPDEDWEIEGVRVAARPVEHPGPTVAYRLESNGRSLAYIPDHEPALGLDLEAVSDDWISGYEVAAGADVLLHDAQYTEEEYPAKLGWGHSSVADAVALARSADVGRLLLFHHDPHHSDDQLEVLLRRGQELWGQHGVPPELAHEGMVIDLAQRTATGAGTAA
jgi:phosphoribosyl 1,2-cyclic phosphodiesterase